MAERVREQVVEDALNVFGCAPNLRQRLVELAREVHAPRARFGLEPGHAAGHELRELRLAKFERECARVYARELEQIVDEARERVSLLAQRGQILVCRRETVVDRVEHRLNRGDRRAQIVARPRDELAPRVEQRLEVARHAVEGAADVGELARAAGGSTRGELAARYLLRGVLEAAQPVRDLRADEQRSAQRGRRRRRCDGEDLDVIVHVEHHESAEDHRGERQPDGEQGEPGKLQADGRKASQREREHEARGERAGPGDERERDHGVSL